MKRVVSKCTILLSLCWTISVYSQAELSLALESITGREALNHTKHLASDELKGRETFSQGQFSAAYYIAGEFQKYGLKHISESENYFQRFEMEYVEVRIPNCLEINGRSYDEGIDFSVAAIGENMLKREVVFVGYGISTKEYDSYADVDVKDKIVMFFEGKIQKRGAKWGMAPLHELRVVYAINRGAAGILFVRGTSPKNHKRPVPSRWPFDRIQQISSRAQKWGLGTWSNELWEKWFRVPLIYITLEVANDILSETGKTVAQLKDEIDKKKRPDSFPLGVTARLHTHISHGPRQTMNVIGGIEGADPELKDEYIIIGAHYDHIGMTDDASGVYNGADDNASGTAALLEIAQAFSEHDIEPKRSILFIAFTGEEMGCLGSHHYINNPLVPISKTVAMFNLDMIGRNDPDEIGILFGNKNLSHISHKVNREVDIHLKTLDKDYFSSSDHFPFHDEGVPIVFYYDGGGRFAHKTTDTWDKLLPGKMEKVARLCFLTVHEVANQE